MSFVHVQKILWKQGQGSNRPRQFKVSVATFASSHKVPCWWEQRGGYSLSTCPQVFFITIHGSNLGKHRKIYLPTLEDLNKARHLNGLPPALLLNGMSSAYNATLLCGDDSHSHQGAGASCRALLKALSWLTSCWTLLAGHSCLTLFLNTLSGHSCLTLFLGTLAWNSFLTLLLATLAGHSSWTLLLDTFAGRSCLTLLLGNLY